MDENLFVARLKANVRTYSLMAELREKNERLRHLATRDGLTGLYNHKHTMHLLEVEIERSQRNHSPLSIVMFDLDHFKHINDTFGHHVGDLVLSDIGKIWHEGARSGDIAGRYGGEEFIVILPDTDLAGAKVYAERI